MQFEKKIGKKKMISKIGFGLRPLTKLGKTYTRLFS
jgi:hypothetical protein